MTNDLMTNDSMTNDSLLTLCDSLRNHPNVAEKCHIARAYSPSLAVAGSIAVGDDAAAIPDGRGWLLFAAEGMMESFIESDPWFAGYCAVMVNLSDIAAMGGRSLAILDVLWTHPDNELCKEVWSGMIAASKAYAVPIAGGHTTRFPLQRTPLLAAAVLGRARRLITSFNAQPGDDLIVAVDLRGSYRGTGTLFWNASVDAPAARLRGDLDLLPKLAEAKLLTGGKDISNGGLPGTLAMLLATSKRGARLYLDALPKPDAVDIQHWLLSFPSYGYVLSASPKNSARVRSRFMKRGITCEVVGKIEQGGALTLCSGGEECQLLEISF